MALDPSLLLAIAALALGSTGAVMIRASRREPACLALAEYGLGFAAGAIGLAMMLVAPDRATSPVRVLGDAAMIFGSGLVWAAARRMAGGAAPRPVAVAAGALGWLGFVLLAEPSLGWRVGVSAAILAAYGLAAARELLRGHLHGGDAQRRGGLVLAAHGGFHALRAGLGASVGLAAWGPALSPGWAAASGLETVLFAVVFGFLAIAASRREVAQPAPEEPLEDALTGIGNRRALFGPGAALLDEAAAAGRPLALLLMGLDGLGRVNARHGSGVGDRLLAAFAHLAHDYLPPTSLVCRLGGDAFAAVLPGAAAERALMVADELRSLFAHLAIDGGGCPVGATVSIGIAQARPERPGLGELLDAADRCLSAAKAAGRDTVVHEAELPDGAFRTAA